MRVRRPQTDLDLGGSPEVQRVKNLAPRPIFTEVSKPMQLRRHSGLRNLRMREMLGAYG